MNVRSILCVCTGNICRSPYAQGLFTRDLPSTQTSSAGIGAVVGNGMPTPAAAIAARQHLGLETHRARQISGPIVAQSELVLVMEEGQKRWLVEQFPESRGRIFLISHWGDKRNVPDPYRHGKDFYEKVFAMIAAYVEDWTQRLAPAPITKHAVY